MGNGTVWAEELTTLMNGILDLGSYAHCASISRGTVDIDTFCRSAYMDPGSPHLEVTLHPESELIFDANKTILKDERSFLSAVYGRELVEKKFDTRMNELKRLTNPKYSFFDSNRKRRVDKFDICSSHRVSRRALAHGYYSSRQVRKAY